jgi:hypothetical protein
MEPLVRYFDGEKQAATLALGLGLLSLAFAVWLYKSASPFRAKLALIAVGVALLFALSRRPLAVGVGMGLLVEAAVMLAFDVFAEQRGAEYLDYLRALT